MPYEFDKFHRTSQNLKVVWVSQTLNKCNIFYQLYIYSRAAKKPTLVVTLFLEIC